MASDLDHTSLILINLTEEETGLVIFEEASVSD